MWLSNKEMTSPLLELKPVDSQWIIWKKEVIYNKEIIAAILLEYLETKIKAIRYNNINCSWQIVFHCYWHTLCHLTCVWGSLSTNISEQLHECSISLFLSLSLYLSLPLFLSLSLSLSLSLTPPLSLSLSLMCQ